MTILSFKDGRKRGFVSFETTNIKFYLIFIFLIISLGTLLLIFFKPYVSLLTVNFLIIIFVYKFIKRENINIFIWKS